MTNVVLKLLRRYGVRYVQLSRAGQKDTDGIVVLSDSRSPEAMVMRGPWRLGEEYVTAGTVPQQAGVRKCSLRSKGFVIDRWVEQEFGDEPFAHAIGFNSQETGRVIRDKCYGGAGRSAFYPLVTWNWTRSDAGLFLKETTGEQWHRSCCTFCCFQDSCGGTLLLERWKHEPDAGVAALEMEYGSLALNPRAGLFGNALEKPTARDFVTGSDDAHVLEIAARADARIEAGAWRIYEVRRVFVARKGEPSRKGPAWRSVRPSTPSSMDRSAAYAALSRLAKHRGLQVRVDDLGYHRVVVRELGPSPLFPAIEHEFVAAPAQIHGKERKGFTKLWARTAGATEARDDTSVLQNYIG